MQQSVSEYFQTFSDKKIKFLVNELSLAVHYYAKSYMQAQYAIMGSENGGLKANITGYMDHGSYSRILQNSGFYSALRDELRRRYGYHLSDSWTGWLGYNLKERQLIYAALETITAGIHGRLPMMTSEKQCKEAWSSLKKLGFRGTLINRKKHDVLNNFGKINNIFTDISLIFHPQHTASVHHVDKSQFVSVTLDNYERGIPIKGWENVGNALRLYSTGKTKGSHAAEDDQLGAISKEHGLLGLGMYLNALGMQDAGGFVEKMIQSAKEQLSESDSWQRSYDYDGQGVFFKTTVGIKVLNREEDLYLLEIYAAYVGSEPENGLASSLHTPLAFIRSTISIETKPHSDLLFVFNFEDIIRTLDPVLNTLLNGEDLARYFIENPKDAYASLNPPVIYKGEGFVVTLAPGYVEHRFRRNNNGDWDDTWSVVYDSCLTGELYEGWGNGGLRVRKPPTFVIEIFQPSGDRWNSKNPIIDEKVKKNINNLSEKIAAAFK